MVLESNKYLYDGQADSTDFLLLLASYIDVASIVEILLYNHVYIDDAYDV
jgi:hypothetical protein